jgi:metal-sulfur cluster biosynthetic enzyme
MNGGPKDNENPVVLSVEPRGRRRRSKKEPLGWREVRAYCAGGDNHSGGGVDGDGSDIEDAARAAEEGVRAGGARRSDADRAVLRALADVSRATNGRGVGLLTRVGWEIPAKAPAASQTNLVVFGSEEEEGGGGEVIGMEIDGAEEGGEEVKRDRLDAEEIFEIVRNIQDPEHPLTLEQLGVVSCEQIEVRDEIDGDGGDAETDADGEGGSYVRVRFTPTIPACSMATLIGLAIKVKLQRSLPPRFKVSVRVERGAHQSEQSINKQLADKERVSAALENPHLLKVMNRCIYNGMTGNMS